MRNIHPHHSPQPDCQGLPRATGGSIVTLGLLAALVGGANVLGLLSIIVIIIKR